MRLTRTIAMRAASHTLLTMSLRMPAWRPGRVQQVPFSRASFWWGLSFSVLIRARSSVRARSHHAAELCHVGTVACVVALLCAELGLKHVIQ